MRILLTIFGLLLVCSANLSAQDDFRSLDASTYNYYLKGDYKNLKKTSDSLLDQGIDYYYLRMRMGILSFNNQLYYSALKNFNKALEYNSIDTLSREYIYYCFLYSGRKADAVLYLKSIPIDDITGTLRSVDRSGPKEFYFRSSVSGSDVTRYTFNRLYYETVKSSISLSAGFETYFFKRLKGSFSFTNYLKSGTVYSESFPRGTALNLIQNQVYTSLTAYSFPGWEFTGFSHIAFFRDITINNQFTSNYTLGAGISRTLFRIRAGANFSISNFGSSNQVRGEGYITYLPNGNLNLYFTSGAMYQIDNHWGSTYQINEEIGFNVLKSLWIESGILNGNSFLYARNQGSVMNNSFSVPSVSVYGNVIFFPSKKLCITLTPFYVENNIYSWDLKTYIKADKLTPSSFGGAVKIIYKY